MTAAPYAFPIEACLSSGANGTRLNSYDLSLWLLAHLTWPSDAVRRQTYIDAHEQDFVSYAIQHVQGRASEDQSRRHVEKTFLRPLARRGGLKRVVDAPPLEVLIRDTLVAISDWMLAAQRLYLTAQLHSHHDDELSHKGGASIGKALALMADHGLGRTPSNTSWADFKPVAHIAAGALQAALEMHTARTMRHALYMFHPIEMQRTVGMRLAIHEVIYQDPVIVLARALAFQNFAFRHRSAKRTQPLLPTSSTCLLIIPGWKIPPVSEFLPPLPPAMISKLINRTNLEKGYWSK